MASHSATYSPEDNKLRLYPAHRLDPEEYAKVRAAGFIWAPKQELFVAPMWTPSREDFLVTLCGEIGDEDTSLIDRAEERAERFEDYSASRADDAERAHSAVAQIADNIPLGQPILIGHHSENHARRDAAKIENGMRKAIKMWETSKYWTDRAKGAISRAKYKEVPAVRHRRIKGLEADKRKQEKTRDDHQAILTNWLHVAKMEDVEKRNTTALHVANVSPAAFSFSFSLDRYPRTENTYEGSRSLWSAMNDGIIDGMKAATLSISNHERSIAYCERWIQHYTNRIAYEKAMLEDTGGIVADRFNIEVGGRVLNRHGEWCVVLRVNRKNGAITSVTTTARYVSKIDIENVKDYRAPEGDDAAKVKAATKLAPMCNYNAEGFHQFTKAQWDQRHADYKGSETIAATPKAGRHRVRRTYSGGVYAPVFLTDSKVVMPPSPDKEPRPLIPANTREPREVYTRESEGPTKFDQLKATLKAGVQVVSAPQLFPTPPALVEQMIALADIARGQTVLEPSAGTGNILEAARDAGAITTAVEINCNLCSKLRLRFDDVRNDDFLQCNGNLGKFDRVIMNPPFSNGDDIKHITHAVTFLKPGGKLVAICANGPRQNEKLKPLASTWEPLPAGTFKDAGTGVNTVLLTINA